MFIVGDLYTLPYLICLKYIQGNIIILIRLFIIINLKIINNFREHFNSNIIEFNVLIC